MRPRLGLATNRLQDIPCYLELATYKSCYCSCYLVTSRGLSAKPEGPSDDYCYFQY